MRERFPDLKVWATAETIAEMERTTPGGRPNPFWGAAFPGLIGDTPVIAEAVPEGGLQVDGQPLVPRAAGHTDTDHTTFLHMPSLDLVVGGEFPVELRSPGVRRGGRGGGATRSSRRS